MSSGSSARSLVRRPPRAIPVVILCVLLLAAGGLGAWLLGTYVVDGNWPRPAADTVSTIGDTSFDSTAMRIGAGLLALLGLVLLLCAIIPGLPSRMRILEDDVPGETAISRRDLARRVEQRVGQVDGVHSVRASVGKRRVDVTVTTLVDDVDAVRTTSTATAEHAITELRPNVPLQPRVRVNRKS